ncbi:MAG: hypothetical protein ACJ77K_09035 [Bacteroidia bacterium]
MSIDINQKITGTITVELQPGKSLEEFCERSFDNYDRDRFEAIAIRFYFGIETVMTLYALDKSRQEGNNYDINKLPVKKFKVVNISALDLLAFIGEFNLTLSAGNYDISDMEVINK